MEIKCIQSAAKLLDIDCVNKGGLDLSKEVLWVSLGQEKILLIGPVRTCFACNGPICRILY